MPLKLDPDLARELAPARERFVNDRKAVIGELAKGNTHPLWTEGYRKKTPDSANVDNHTLVFAVTTPTVDSYGDVVIPEGVDLERYRKNPVVLNQHDYWDRLPIGKSLREEVDPGVAVYSETQFAVGLTPDPRDDYPLLVFNYYLAEFLNAVSIGFIPKKWEKRYIDDADGDQVWKGGYVINEWEMLEHSVVSVPANEDALVLAARGVNRFSKELGLSHAADDARPPLTVRGSRQGMTRDEIADLVREIVQETAGNGEGNELRAKVRMDLAFERGAELLRNTFAAR